MEGGARTPQYNRASVQLNLLECREALRWYHTEVIPAENEGSVHNLKGTR